MNKSQFRKAIVTSGPTREWVDPVGYIANASSGKMGFCISKELIKQIPNLVYIHGPIGLNYMYIESAKIIYAETTIKMMNSILSELEEDTILIMAAAPSDFRPIKSTENKIKKVDNSLIVEFTQNPDILLTVKNTILEKDLKNVSLVGFAAETEKLDIHAKEKLERKGLTYIIGNYVSRDSGFGDRDSSVRIYSKNGLEKELGPLSKEELSRQILEFIFES